MNPRYLRDSRLPHPGIHQAKVDARLDAIEAQLKEVAQPKPILINRWDELHPYAQTLVSRLINHLASTQ